MLPLVTNEIKVEIAFDGATFVELVEATTINHTSDKEVAEYSKLSSKHKVRVATGGITNDYTFEGKLVIDQTADSFYRKLRDVYTGDNLGNGVSIQLTYPHSTDPNKTGEIRKVTGVIKLSQFGGQAADDLATVVIDFMSSGKPEITDEEI